MADEARSPAKKRRKTEKKNSDEKEEVEGHKKSVKRTGKIGRRLHFYLYASLQYVNLLLE